jgi:hypothetical protein
MTDQDAGIGGIVSEIMNTLDQPATDQSATDAIDPNDPFGGGTPFIDPDSMPDPSKYGGSSLDAENPWKGIDPGFDVDETNASNAESRRKAIEEGMDEQTAYLVYPDIDRSDPFRIN